jgi:hypothetical protein
MIQWTKIINYNTITLFSLCAFYYQFLLFFPCSRAAIAIWWSLSRMASNSGKPQKLNLSQLQEFHSITLRVLSNVSYWYVSNRTLHHVFNIPIIMSKPTSQHYNQFHKNFFNHANLHQKYPNSSFLHYLTTLFIVLNVNDHVIY